MLLKATFICCFLATAFAVDDHKLKKKDIRGKRNLEYTISHHYTNPNHRLERRISTGPQITRFPPFFPGRAISYRKGRPQSLPPPPYAVQMEPLVQYSQRDPLYDVNILPIPTVGQNDLAKTDDLLSENNHLSENVYGPPKHVIERPIYIKDPEPIIEIIIKESNVTLPPIPVQQITPAPKKKEQVQVFYVKYKKNPNGQGKDSIIYEKPIPAISPKIKDDVEEEHHHDYSPREYVTSAPPPSTTLRAIIKPDSETYHAHKGIHITFGSEHAHEKIHDDVKEESAPEPAISFPQSREFHGNLPRRQPGPVQNFPPNFRPDAPRVPQPYRPFNQPPSPAQLQTQYPQFGKKMPINYQQAQAHNRNPPPTFQTNVNRNPAPQLQAQPPSRNPPPPFHNTHISRPHPPQFSQQLPSPQNNNFRQPVPYQPFDQLRPQQQDNKFQFPRPHSHFPLPQQLNQQSIYNQQHPNRQQQPQQSIYNPYQQLPLVQQDTRFNQQLKQEQSNPIQLHNLQQQSFGNQGHDASHIQQTSHLHNAPQNNQQPDQNQEYLRQQKYHQEQFKQQQQQQQNQQQLHSQQQQNFHSELQNQHVIPPGGELVPSVSKYEQHFSVGENSQPEPTQALAQQQQQPRQNHLSPEEFRYQIQQQFQQSSVESNHQLISSQQQQQRQQQQQPPQSYQQQQQQLQLQHQQQLLKQQPRSQYQQQFNQQTQPNLQYHQQVPQYITSTTPPTTIRTTTTERPRPTTEKQPETTTKDIKELNLQLPDEVPDDLREQLLSSGILNHAHISVLDYDKVGDIPLSALPPDQLANFYGAGGAQQLAAGSAPVPSVIKPDTEDLDDQNFEGSENEEVKVKKPEVEMKVVHYDPQTEEGQKIQDKYVQDGATEIDPVVLNDQSYNRYLPLKVSGAQFPIPDIPELKGKQISSVVVLAPVDYNFKDNTRVTRNADKNLDGIKFVADSPLKLLIDNPSRENYIKFLDSENKTTSDKQSVILLVTGSKESPAQADSREIFMYDVATQTVSKLNGELSSAFVDAAEANTDKSDDTSVSASNLVEVRVPSPSDVDRVDHNISDDLEDSSSQIVESRIPIIDPMEVDMEPEASEQLQTFVDISGHDLLPSDSRNSIENEVRIESGYSKTGYNLPLH